MVFNTWLKILEALQLSIDQETRRWVELGIKRGVAMERPILPYINTLNFFSVSKLRHQPCESLAAR